MGREHRSRTIAPQKNNDMRLDTQCFVTRPQRPGAVVCSVDAATRPPKLPALASGGDADGNLAKNEDNRPRMRQVLFCFSGPACDGGLGGRGDMSPYQEGS